MQIKPSLLSAITQGGWGGSRRLSGEYKEASPRGKDLRDDFYSLGEEGGEGILKTEYIL